MEFLKCADEATLLLSPVSSYFLSSASTSPSNKIVNILGHDGTAFLVSILSFSKQKKAGTRNNVRATN